jgi:iron-sulfur cluster repair protein YtfE (RIC family)
MKNELDLHMHKEEGVLFPAIEETERAANGGPPASHVGALVYPIRVMLTEHESATSSMERIREITCDYTLPAPASDLYSRLFVGFEALEHDLQGHFHLENEIMFPRGYGASVLRLRFLLQFGPVESLNMPVHPNHALGAKARQVSRHYLAHCPQL